MLQRQRRSVPAVVPTALEQVQDVLDTYVRTIKDPHERAHFPMLLGAALRYGYNNVRFGYAIELQFDHDRTLRIPAFLLTKTYGDFRQALAKDFGVYFVLAGKEAQERFATALYRAAEAGTVRGPKAV